MAALGCSFLSSRSSPMSSRHLVIPSRSESLRETTTFKLQPPPHRYKENRRCRVLFKRDDAPAKSLVQASLAHIKSPLSPRRKKRGSTSSPLLEEAISPAIDNDASSTSDEDVQSVEQESPARLGGVMTSPVRGEVRNSAFFGDPCVWSPQSMTGYDTSVDKCPSASRTSSYHSIARTVTTFGVAVRKRGSSLQSVQSPTEKQCGYSGSTSSKSAAHTILPMSPLSPLALKTVPSLDTPADLHFDRINTHLVLPICENQDEPLSATLKRLGAARRSMDLCEEDERESSDALYSHASLAGWERSLADRVASQKQAVEASRANQEALQQANGLFQTCSHQEQRSKAKTLRYPWLDRDPNFITSRPEYSRIQSTARGEPRRNIRSSISSISTVLANHIFRRGQERIQEEGKAVIPLNTIAEDTVARPAPAAPRPTGDGWGGLRPRSSWFPDLTFGPLISPVASSPSKQHLRPLQLLQPSQPLDRDPWVDEVGGLDVEQDDDASLSVEEQDDSIRTLRVRFPSYLPKPSRDRHGSPASSDQGTTVTYTRNSAEGRPTSTRQSLQIIRTNGGLLLAFLLVIGMASVVAFIGTRAIRHASSFNASTGKGTDAVLPSIPTATV